MINLYASVDGRDLGAVATDIAKVTSAAEKDLPKGSAIFTRGQIGVGAASATVMLERVVASGVALTWRVPSHPQVSVHESRTLAND